MSIALKVADQSMTRCKLRFGQNNAPQSLWAGQQARQAATAGVQQRLCVRFRHRAGHGLHCQKAPQLQPQRLVMGIDTSVGEYKHRELK